MAIIVTLAFFSACIVAESLQTYPQQLEQVHALAEENLCSLADTQRSCSEAPWRPSSSSSWPPKELCVEGKSLPKLYLLGAQKTSTSSFAHDLMCAGVRAVPGPGGNAKEFNYFIAGFWWESAEDEQAGWLRNLPTCDSEDPKLVADFSPNNLRTVNGETLYGSRATINLPSTLSTYYGEHRNKITLVAMLRDPISRMQSAWYAARKCRNRAICKTDCKGPSFQADVKTALSNARQSPPLYTEWLWTSMYGRQLEEWLKHFDAQQMYVIPYKQYTDGDADVICRDLAKRLEFDMDCESNGRKPTHQWNNEHPSLADDLTPELADAFNAVMRLETKRLVEALASGHAKGMGLANFNGTKGSKAEIRDWLESWW